MAFIDPTDECHETEIKGARSALVELERKEQLIRAERQRLDVEERCMRLQRKVLKKILDAGKRNGKETAEECANTQRSFDSDSATVALRPSEVSTMATASNLPGPGRGLGKLYSRGGRILERSISLIAHRLGFGPYAVSLRMIGPVSVQLGIEMSIFCKAWRSMLMYIQFGTPMTQLTATRRLAAALAWTGLVWDDYAHLMRRSIRAIENNIDEVFDPQHIFHASLTLLRSNRVSFVRVFERLLWLQQVVKTWYGGVTDIFRDDLVDLFSRTLYEDVYQAFEWFTRERGRSSVDYNTEGQKLVFKDALLAFHFTVELLRESLRQAFALAEHDLSSCSTSVLWPRDDDPLSLRDTGFFQYGKLRVRRRTINGCLELDGSEIELLRGISTNINRVQVLKQYRFEELFIPNTQIFDMTQSSSVARVNREFIITAEHRHDLEVWRREICEISRRRGVYLGRRGTFVMVKWEVAVLPGVVMYEGETEEEVNVSYKENWRETPERYYRCVDTTLGKLDPWRMGLVAFQPSRKAGQSTADQKKRRKRHLPRFLSSISRR